MVTKNLNQPFPSCQKPKSWNPILQLFPTKRWKLLFQVAFWRILAPKVKLNYLIYHDFCCRLHYHQKQWPQQNAIVIHRNENSNFLMQIFFADIVNLAPAINFPSHAVLKIIETWVLIFTKYSELSCKKIHFCKCTVTRRIFSQTNFWRLSSFSSNKWK